MKLIIINCGDSNRLPVWKRSLKALRFALVSCRLALSEPCDLVIASSGPITVGLPALAAKWFRGKKMIFEIRDLWPQGAIELGKINNRLVQLVAGWFEKLCYNNSSLVVACSEGMEQSVLERFPGTKAIVVPNASDAHVFAGKASINFEIPEQFKNKSIFLYAGSLGIMDHGRLLIRAMKRISNKRICLVVLGEGAERKELENICREENIGNVYFMGLLPKFEVAGWMAACTASLVVFRNFPVLQTSSPNKMFDSFAAGVPVIHNTTGWIRDMFEKEGCGISVGPEDDEGLAAAIEKLSGDKTLRDKMALNAKRLADTRFNRDRLAAMYLSEILKIHKG